jgi:putative ABC transport system permease protein
MILLLVGHGIAQSVRERIPEFAVLKTLGFSDGAVMALVFLEAAVPCLLGAALGFGLAAVLTTQIHRIVPPGWGIPMPYLSPSVLGSAVALSLLVAFVSAVLPALRLMRMNIATALTRG